MRHEHGGPAQRSVERDVPEAGTGEDLQVLGQPVHRGRRLRRGDRRVGEPIGGPHDVAGVGAGRGEAKHGGEPGPVQGDAAATHAADTRRGAIRPPVHAFQPVEVAHGFLTEPGQVVPERRWLGRLEVRRIRPQRPGVRHGLAGGRGGEAGHRLVRIKEEVAQGEPERDPARFPPGAPGMQPAGDAAQAAFQFPLPAVVHVAVGRVVRELLRGRAERVEQGVEQGGGIAGRDDLGIGEREHMRQVG